MKKAEMVLREAPPSCSNLPTKSFPYTQKVFTFWVYGNAFWVNGNAFWVNGNGFLEFVAEVAVLDRDHELNVSMA